MRALADWTQNSISKLFFFDVSGQPVCAEARNLLSLPRDPFFNLLEMADG